VAVVIEDRLVHGVVEVQPAGPFGGEEIIFVEKRFGRHGRETGVQVEV
jgi:hypothetical protein